MCDRGVQVLSPPRHAQLGKAVDEIEAHIVESCRADSAHRRNGLLMRVNAADQAQFLIVCRLHSERDTVEAGASKLPQRAFFPRAVGVCLSRDLGFSCHMVMRKNCFQNAAEPVGAQIARCAAAEVNGVNGTVLRLGRPMDQIVPQRLGVGVHLLLRTRQGIEIAVNALRFAKRDMEIQSQRSHRVSSFVNMFLPIVTQTMLRARCSRADIPPVSGKDYGERSDLTWI